MLRIRPSHLLDEPGGEQPHIAGERDQLDVMLAQRRVELGDRTPRGSMPSWLFAQLGMPSRLASTSPRASGTFEATSTIS